MRTEATANINDPAFWDRSADYRNQVNDFTSLYSERAWQLAALPQEALVLDIAAGAGALTRHAAASGNSVLATDFSAGMVEAIAALGMPAVETRVMDGQALDLPDCSFDAAFSMFGVMLFPDWREGLSEMVRVLRPGGLACVGTWAEPSGAGPNLLIANVACWMFPSLAVPEIAPGMVEWADPDRFGRALEAAGLENVRFHDVSSDFVIDLALLADPKKLFQFSPVWSALEAKQRRKMLDELADLATRNHGQIAVASPALVAIGTKSKPT